MYCSRLFYLKSINLVFYYSYCYLNCDQEKNVKSVLKIKLSMKTV